jgi:flavin reductase (DIM6/NTAB) family NADH-FMN oxidoreductase RutF
MNRTTLSAWDLSGKPFSIWERDWLLLSSGDFAAKKFNSMTVSWGSFGVMWGKPIAIVVVRPQRYTYEFMEQYDTFTLCAFAPEQRKVLDLLGTKSGRDIDKINEAGITPIAASAVASPIYEEAELAIECRKAYYEDLKPRHFLADYIKGMYKKDYHRVYWGEVVAVAATEKYQAS